MSVLRVTGGAPLSGEATVLGALAAGENRVRGWLAAGDTLATLGALSALGIDVERDGSTLRFVGSGLRAPQGAIDCANAGTAMRLLAGLLAGQPFESVLDGSTQLRGRPMRRVTGPLREMGADIRDDDGRAPLRIRPAALHGKRHDLAVASAQVKSALLLAGLHADGVTEVIEPGPSRDHTERMLAAMGAPVEVDGHTVRVRRADGSLRPLDLIVPGDLSSAAFLLAAAAAQPGADVLVSGVGLNPTRTGVLDALRAMGADLRVGHTGEAGGEPVGAVRVQGGGLRGAEIAGALVVRAIDELPVLAVAATQAEGETRR